MVGYTPRFVNKKGGTPRGVQGVLHGPIGFGGGVTTRWSVFANDDLLFGQQTLDNLLVGLDDCGNTVHGDIDLSDWFSELDGFFDNA